MKKRNIRHFRGFCTIGREARDKLTSDGEGVAAGEMVKALTEKIETLALARFAGTKRPVTRAGARVCRFSSQAATAMSLLRRAPNATDRWRRIRADVLGARPACR